MNAPLAHARRRRRAGARAPGASRRRARPWPERRSKPRSGAIDDEHRWRALWDAEIVDLPSHRESRFWLVAGLLLPIWDRLPDESMRVRRLVADDGRAPDRPRPRPGRGQRVSRSPGSRRRPGPHRRGDPRRDHGTRGASFPLANGWKLARRRLMGANRIEIEGPADGDIDPAQAHGLHRRDRLLAHPPVRARPRHPGARRRPLAPRGSRRRPDRPPPAVDPHRRLTLPPAVERAAAAPPQQGHLR